MAENRQNRCCERALARARLSDITPTLEDIGWLFGITKRWASALRSQGVLPEGTPLPQLIERMAAHRATAKAAQQRGRRATDD